MQLLGGLPPRTFLRRYWQKRPLLVRGALPGFAGVLDKRALAALAVRDDVESRIVKRRRGRWETAHGPFSGEITLRRNSTLLVSGVNLHLVAADALLRRFAFVPQARLDDLMVSYAAAGGGVGPHVDSYDVFLLQGFGRRRWRYGCQDDCTLDERLPLKILKRFTPARDDVLGPGDMLYLPPQFAHEGTALDACTTYSIGFRAAGANELATAFLDFLRDGLDLPGRYADPGLAPTRHPARIDAAMRRQCAGMLARIRWDAADIARFLGCWLSEPKPQVFFAPPTAPLPRAAFARAAARRGMRLDRRTQLLYDNHHLFINGTARPWPAEGARALARLADRRSLDAREAAALPAPVVALLHDWYRDGFLRPDAD